MNFPVDRLANVGSEPPFTYLSSFPMAFSNSLSPIRPSPKSEGSVQGMKLTVAKQGSSLDSHGKRKLLDNWEDSPLGKKMSSSSGSLFSPLSGPPIILEAVHDLFDEDDKMLAELKLQRKKLQVRKHWVISDMKKEFMLLLQAKKSELAKLFPKESKMAEEAGLTMPPPSL